MKTLICILALVLGMTANAQVAINTDGSLPDNSAMLDVKSTEKGVLFPRMTLSQRNAITNPAAGLTIFQTDNTPGLYYNSGSGGNPIWSIVGSGSGWSITGNSGTTPGTNFIGTADGQPLMFKVNNQKAGYIDYALPFNAGFGYQTLNSITTGIDNTAIGNYSLPASTTGYSNTAIGYAALFNNTTGNQNTANGQGALYYNTEGSNNTASGFGALVSNTTGNYNTASGENALYNNRAGNNGVAFGYYSQVNSNSTTTSWDNTNTSIGFQSLKGSATPANNTGINNTAIGRDALFSNTTGSDNTANGFSALFSNTTGFSNTANGMNALSSNTTGFYNTANGVNALTSNTEGYSNTAIGRNALYASTTACHNTAIGYSALSSQSYSPGYAWNSDNVAVGYQALMLNQSTYFLNGISNTAVGTYAMRGGGSRSTAIGFEALYSGSGEYNTAIGGEALYSVTTGYENTATGQGALYGNTTGHGNTANGVGALAYNNAGTYNTAIGHEALNASTTGIDNTAIGTYALDYNVGGNDNTALGFFSGTAYGAPNASNTVSIGNNGYLNGASNQAFIGNLSTFWNGGNVPWYTYSDARVKNNVQEDVKGLDFITRLRPVTYHRSIKAMAEITGNKETKEYPEKYDIEKIKFSGFLAQDVEQAARDADYDFSGITIPKNSKDLYTLSYEQFVVPLVKAVQELNTRNEAQKVTNEELKLAIEELKAKNEQLMKLIEKSAPK